MKDQDKQTLFSFLWELLRLIFSIGQKHVERRIDDNDNDNDNLDR